MKKYFSFACLLLLQANYAFSITVKVVDEFNKPIPLVMVTEKVERPDPVDDSDGGYQKPTVARRILPEITKFTNKQGLVTFADREFVSTYRLRKFHYQDQLTKTIKGKELKITLNKEIDPVKLAAAKTANSWLGALEVGSAEDKIIFKMQCGYCHQQGTEFTRQERTEQDWEETIKRMVRYGSRLPTDLQKSLPKILAASYRKLRANPSLLAEPVPWGEHLEKITLKEWPIGDAMSQVHDMLVSDNGMVYVADNIQDRLYEVNPVNDEVTVYKIPHRKGDTPGGLIAGRLKDFPRHDSTSNAHSLAQSKVDGHIFITPSAQRRLVEFDPMTKSFLLHEMDQGFYPHTIRVDRKDNVWFTLALSNQVAKFDRGTQKFKFYDLPARNFKEKIITKYIYYVFKLINMGIPLSNWLPIDRVSTSVPLVYGIDITPDNKVWFARLHTKEIGMINPETDEIKMIPTPFWGPRRLRTDLSGNLWIGSFGESKLAKFTPATNEFKLFDLPVGPIGSDTPYSLNVHQESGTVWVTGNQSDSVHIFNMKSETWQSVPFSRRTTFTRDIEFSHLGEAYTSNSNFPSWQIEDSQPTLIQIKRD